MHRRDRDLSCIPHFFLSRLSPTYVLWCCSTLGNVIPVVYRSIICMSLVRNCYVWIVIRYIADKHLSFLFYKKDAILENVAQDEYCSESEEGPWSPCARKTCPKSPKQKAFIGKEGMSNLKIGKSLNWKILPLKKCCKKLRFGFIYLWHYTWCQNYCRPTIC